MEAWAERLSSRRLRVPVSERDSALVGILQKMLAERARGGGIRGPSSSSSLSLLLLRIFRMPGGRTPLPPDLGGRFSRGALFGRNGPRNDGISGESVIHGRRDGLLRKNSLRTAQTGGKLRGRSCTRKISGFSSQTWKNLVLQ